MRRYFNGNVILHVSREVIKNKLLSLEAMKVVTKHGKETWVSKGRTYMIDNEAHEIVSLSLIHIYWVRQWCSVWL